MSFVSERELSGTENSFIQLQDSSESYCILNGQTEHSFVRCFNKNSPENSHRTNLNINKCKRSK
jgi:hypothetical protein